MKKLGIYVHIPFCIQRCNYCSFYSTAVGEDVSPEVYAKEALYIDRQIRKIEKYGLQYRDQYEVDSIYIGGGTPTILEPELIEDLLRAIRRVFVVDSDCEITIESNPKTITKEKMEKLISYGINRLSMGLQSFSEPLLKALGRVHTGDEFRESYQIARIAGMKNINIDVMFGIPGQTEAEWMDTLEEVIRLNPEHISFYSLQIEEGTTLYDNYRKGLLPEINTELDRRMYHQAISELNAAGYKHYEISNAAKLGYSCRHNLKYWSFEDYLGIGANASSFMAGVRFTEEPGKEYHLNDFMDDAGEYVFTGLRKRDGISRKAFAEKFGRSFWEVFGDRREELKDYLEQGLLLEDGDTLRLSEEGIDCSNEIMAVFV